MASRCPGWPAHACDSGRRCVGSHGSHGRGPWPRTTDDAPGVLMMALWAEGPPAGAELESPASTPTPVVVGPPPGLFPGPGSGPGPGREPERSPDSDSSWHREFRSPATGRLVGRLPAAMAASIYESPRFSESAQSGWPMGSAFNLKLKMAHERGVHRGRRLIKSKRE